LQVAGTIDCLWQDADNAWHLLRWDTSPTLGGGRPSLVAKESPSRAVPFPPAQRPGLAVCAWAVHQQLGHWPATVSVYSFADGTSVSLTGKRFGFETSLADVEAGLTALLHAQRPSR
jgi:hypothetical protein